MSDQADPRDGDGDDAGENEADEGGPEDPGQGLGPPPHDVPGQDLAPPEDERADASAAPDWGASGEPTLPGAPVPVAPPAQPPWPGSTGPADLPPPPPPRKSGRRLGLVAAILVLLGGAVAGIAIALSGGKTATVSKPTAAPTAAPSPSLVPPAALSADPTAFSVTLSWTQPPGGSPVQNYDIYRDDAFIIELDAATTTYTDGSLTPGKKYSYGLRAASGELETGFVTITVSTPKPAVKDGRIAGDFNVKFTKVSSSGFQSLDSKFTAGWHFKPKCDAGACDVTWSDLTEKDQKATLDRKGASYSGEDPSAHFGSCSGRATSSTLTVDLTVTKAKGISGEWRVTRFEGTVTFAGPSQLGCVSTTATYKVAGTLLT